MNDEQKRLIEALISTKCRCGNAKASKQTFCRTCYLSLPKQIRQALYKRISQGYEEAYAAAAERLDGAE